MVNSTISGICTALKAAYPAYSIYKENVHQDLEPPCFHINLISSDFIKQAGRRAELRNQYDIKFFPDEGGEIENQCNSVMMNLLDQLAFITLPDGDLLRATNISVESVDDVLHFSCGYNIPVISTTEQGELMRELNESVGLNNG